MIPVGILTASATSNFVGLLDLYPGAAAAYSFRKLRSSYTGNCIRVRRNFDLAELDIGFVNNVLDTTTLLAFAGLIETKILRFYDQSGNGNNAIGSFSLPIIVSTGGILITDNGKVAGNSGNLDFSNITQNSSFASYSVMTRISNNSTVGFGTNISGQQNYIHLSDANNMYSHNTLNQGRYSYTTAGRRLFTSLNISNTFTMLLNGVNQSVVTTGQTASGIINQVNGSVGTGFSSTNTFQEHIFYNTNQLANNTGIQNNINSFYLIY
jgi:hypothetical protein